MGQCATVTVSRSAVTPGSTAVSMLNGQEEEEEEEEEEEDVCKGCICEGCKCCAKFMSCLKRIGLCLL